MKKVLILMVVLGLFCMPFYSTEVAKANGDTAAASGDKLAERVIVKLKKPVEKAAIEGYEVLANQENDAAPIVTVDVPDGQDVESFIKDLENDSDVEYAEPDHLIKLNHVPNDSYYSLQWHHQNIESERTWDQTKGSSDVVVAVIDNGVDVDHPEFAGRIVAPYDTVYNTTTMTKGDHGTHVAGIIGSSMDNWMGLAGVAPETSIMPIDAFFNEESAYSSDVIEGIYYAVNNGADIINMSLGNYYYSSVYNDAIQYAYDNGVVVIAAAGNDNTSDSHYPSSYSNVISVASTTEYDTKSGFSNYGYDIDIAAPGSSILSTLPDSEYGWMDGTSMASPVVAGVAALILANEPDLTNDQVADRLYASADDLGASGKDYFYGHGRVNAREAVGVARYVAPPQVSQVYDYSTYVSGTVETDDDSYIEVSNGQEVIGSGYPYWGSFNIDISKQPAGTTLWVTVTDGDATSKATTITVMDGTGPDVPTVNEVTDRHTSVTGKAEAGATVEVKAGPEIIGSSTSDGSFTVGIPKQKAGSELSVYAIDGAGNQSGSAVVTVKDKTAPAKPTVNPVGDNSTTITGKAEASSKVVAKVGSTELGRATTNSSGEYTITISKQKVGTEISVYAADGAGNQSETVKITVEDKTAPAKPTVNPVGDQSTSITGKAEINATVYAKVGSTEIGKTSANGTGDFTLAISKQKAGTEISVYAVDAAGNQGEVTIVKVEDKTAPAKPTVNPVGDNSTAITGKAEASSIVVAKVGSTELGRATTNSSGAYSITISKQKVGIEISVYAADGAGNQSETVKVTVEDKTAPAKPSVNPVGDQSTSITGKAEANSTVYASTGSTEIGKTSAKSNGEFTIAKSKQKAGTEISVHAEDQAGNKSAVSKVQVEKEKPQLKTLIGTTRYSTAVEVSKQGWDTSTTVFLVNGGAIADGLTATPLASAHDAPILLTTKGTLPAETEAELKRLGTKKIVLIGGSGVISDEVKGSLVKLGYSVSRIGGKDRYETSLLIAKQLDKSVDVTEAYLAYGRGEPDALSIAAQSGKVKQPIILSEKKSVPKATYDWLKSEDLSNAHFIGGAAVLDSAIMKEMNSITTKNVEGNRISGLSRHDTNAKVIEKFYTENHYPTILIAKSETAKLVDALSAGPLASKLGVPVLLVSQKGLERSQIDTIEGKTSSEVHQIGGGINEAVVGEVLKYMD
ncbi:Ig-like domain-containing protein [Rossellomorea sp. GCM10028870]|uniref:Ig-like domain-containing protein n=1 Tax=Rossellomorea sp. GCM10028870 TaxID=3273426 RepID=UPI003606E26B